MMGEEEKICEERVEAGANGGRSQLGVSLLPTLTKINVRPLAISIAPMNPCSDTPNAQAKYDSWRLQQCGNRCVSCWPLRPTHLLADSQHGLVVCVKAQALITPLQ